MESILIKYFKCYQFIIHVFGFIGYVPRETTFIHFTRD